MLEFSAPISEHSHRKRSSSYTSLLISSSKSERRTMADAPAASISRRLEISLHKGEAPTTRGFRSSSPRYCVDRSIISVLPWRRLQPRTYEREPRNASSALPHPAEHIRGVPGQLADRSGEASYSGLRYKCTDRVECWEPDYQGQRLD